MTTTPSNLLASTAPTSNMDEQTSSFQLKLITQFYPPDFAASGQFMDELAQNLARQGVDVQVFTAQPGYAFDQENAPAQEWMGNVWVERSNFLRGASRQWAGRTIASLAFCVHTIWHLLKPQNRGDVLLLTSEPPFQQTIGLLMKWLFQVRFATLIYDLYPEVAVELGVLSQNHWLIQFWNWVNRKVWQAADEIIVPCQTMKDRVIKHCPEVAEKVTIIHNWADPTWIRPILKTDNPFVQEHDLADKFVVLYSGNMGRCHDMDTIVNAALALKDEAIEFVFVGGGAKREQVMQQIQALKLKNCRFLPYQDKAILPLSLTACDLSLVSVDKGMEGLVAPSKFYSALCAGRPVAIICETHSYLRSLVSDANCGIAVQNGDSQGLANFIRYLAKDRTMAERMGKCGYRFIQEYFTPRQIAQQYYRVLQRSVMQNADLYRSAQRGDFQVAYQPIAALGSQKIVSIQASILWQHPTRGLICPADFAAAIEEANLGLPVNWWFLGEVCRQISHWQAQGLAKDLKISMNLSHQVFTHPALLSQLDTLVELHQIATDCLQFEINDSEAMIDSAATTTAILQLKARNISVCISNFGYTYLSLDYLHRFSIDTLKISSSLVNRIDFDPESTNFLATIVTIAQDLGMRVIANGIESPEELRRLREMGIQYGQGYQLFPSVPTMEMTLCLASQSNQVLTTTPTMLQPATTETFSTQPSSTKSYADSHLPLVLIADDDRSMRSILKAVVQKAGCQVIEAGDGQSAIDLFQDRQPDLVLLDAMMPKVDGFTCCRCIQEITQAQANSESEGGVVVAVKPFPVLLITALDDPASIEQAFLAGATDYITKPINWAILQQKISRLLS